MMVTTLLLGLAVCAGAPPPCTCIPSPPLTSRTDVAATVSAFGAVFEGTVVRTAFRDARGTDRLPALEVTVAVGRRWKGELGDTVTLRTPAATEACGADFAEGRTYLVFGRLPDYTGVGAARPARAGEVVYTTKCSPTAAGRDAQRIAALLGQPLPPGSAAARPNVPEA